MGVRIFYFTGTGNSLIAAKILADKLTGQIDPIIKYMEQQSVFVEDNVIGIVFPVYLAQIYGIPEIVKHFLQKLVYDKNKYYFIVCTYGGYAYPNAFPTIRNCNKLVKSCNGNINGRFYVRFPMNNLDYDHIPVPIERDTNVILIKAYNRLKYISNLILKKKKGNIVSQNIFNCTLGRLFSFAVEPIMKSMRKYARVDDDSQLSYHQLVHLSDKSIIYKKEKCTGCGICEKICPVNNIQLDNGVPNWKHNCEMCFACDEWCPQKAIHHWGKCEGKNYHHPMVGINDMVTQKQTQ